MLGTKFYVYVQRKLYRSGNVSSNIVTSFLCEVICPVGLGIYIVACQGSGVCSENYPRASRRDKPILYHVRWTILYK